MMPLEIGKDGFSLPIELVTSTQAILARKRSGKSYTASVHAEELLRHKQQIAAIDPVGREAANRPNRPATTKELQDRIFALLGEGERKLPTWLIDSYPEPFHRVRLAEKAGYSNAKSGDFAAPLARLIELGFAEAVGNGVVRGSEMLFLKRRAEARR